MALKTRREHVDSLQLTFLILNSIHSPLGRNLYKHSQGVMAQWMKSMFGGRRNTSVATTEAIVGLREQLVMIDKKNEYTSSRVEEEHRKAKELVSSNKPGESLHSNHPILPALLPYIFNIKADAFLISSCTSSA